MSLILNIETSGKACSVAISENSELKSFKLVNEGDFKHAEMLHVLAEATLKDCRFTFNDLAAIAVSIGPGSYTGLRVGVSAAKGWCYALSIPFISVSTLEVMAKKMLALQKANTVIPMMDARRDEVYLQKFDGNLNALSKPEAIILSELKLDENEILFGGDGCEKAKKYFDNGRNKFYPEVFATADFMVQRAYDKFAKQEIENVAYVEPFYLKEFYTKPSV